MKGLFPQYEERTAKDYESAWAKGLFVLDTNVLLNLYRYHSETRESLIKVLKELKQRIWIPHHVALEFQRNRLSVIAEQEKKFIDVRKTVENSKRSLIGELDKLQLENRHSLIDPQPLKDGFQELVDQFLRKLEEQREKQQKVTGSDPLKREIEALFEGSVGLPPKDQPTLDKIYEEATQHFSRKIPPGYKDSEKSSKDNGRTNEFMHDSLIYKKEFGDYLIWHQILAHCASDSVDYLIFVTDDGKEDWWNKIDSSGAKIVGPRTELVEEALTIGRTKSFTMYSPSTFLTYAKEHLKANVSQQTLDEVRQISETRYKNGSAQFSTTNASTMAFVSWLSQFYDSAGFNVTPSPDIIAEKDGKMYAFDAIECDRVDATLLKRVTSYLKHEHHALLGDGFSQTCIVLISNSKKSAEKVWQILYNNYSSIVPKDARILIGACLPDMRFDSTSFVPIDDISLNRGSSNPYDL